jgi:hypothetical protein
MYRRVGTQLVVLLWEVLETLEGGGLAGGSRSLSAVLEAIYCPGYFLCFLAAMMWTVLLHHALFTIIY